MKTPKKVVTDDESINNAEEKLGIKYPEILREWLKGENGFYRAAFRFYGVLDKEDVYNTFDDVVRENTNPEAGWEKYVPDGHVAIADDEGLGCLTLNKNKDGKVYYWNNELGELEIYAENGDRFKERIEREEDEYNEEFDDTSY